MSSPYATAPQAYRANAVLTASPEQLVVMLFDGAHRFLLQAAAAMREQDLQRGNERLQRAEAIIDELLATLDMSHGEIPERLAAIYSFCRRRLGEARIDRDPMKVDQVDALMWELREAFAQAAG